MQWGNSKPDALGKSGKVEKNTNDLVLKHLKDHIAVVATYNLQKCRYSLFTV